MKSKELKYYNLPREKEANSSIDAKPYPILFGVIIIGIILLFVGNARLYGYLMIGISFLCLLCLPARILIDFYDEYLVLYNRSNHDDCFLVYYDEIVSWSYIRGIKYDELIIELVDGNSEKIEGFSKMTFEGNLNKYVKEKKKKSKK